MGDPDPRTKKRLAIAIGIVTAFYGVNAFFNHTPVGAAWKAHEGLYLMAFWLPIGVVFPALFLGWMSGVGSAPARRLGVGIGWRDAVATLAALTAGALLTAAPLAPALRQPGAAVTVYRLFALLLIASTAEVLVFGGVLANSLLLSAPGNWKGCVMAIAGSSLAFGFFHLTYPPPWNSAWTCLGLSVVWLGVALVFLASHSLVAAVAFNNLMAVVGFMRNGSDLPGNAAQGWLRFGIGLGVFSLGFFLAAALFERRTRRGTQA